MSSLLGTVLAISWEPELRGILTVIIAVAVLCGSLYLLLATNLGARLGFLVSFAALAGWMFLMGIVWMIYGIGMQGPAPTWEPVEGRAVLQSSNALASAGVLSSRVDVPDDATFADEADIVADRLVAEGWEMLDPDSSDYGQAVAGAEPVLTETDTFAAGEYEPLRVYAIGGERWPKINESLDFIAFMHDPHYIVVEVAPLEETRTEPGRAPASNVIDESRQRQYVYMVRDLGALRQPAQVLTLGAGLIFGTCCWLLHRRDAIVERNLAAPTPAG